MQTEIDEIKLANIISLSGGVYIGESEYGEGYRLVMLDCQHVVHMRVDDIARARLDCCECEEETAEAVTSADNVFRLDDYR